MHEPYTSQRKSSVDSILSDGKTSTKKPTKNVSEDEYVQLQPSQSRHQATNLDNYFNEKRVISTSIQTQVGTDLQTQSTQTTANNEPYSRRDIEDVDIKSDISSLTSRPSSRNTSTKTDVVSTGTNTSTHRKSVSFDLGEFEYTPVYTEENDDESVFQHSAVNAPTETTFDDGYEVPRCSPPALPTIEKSQKKGILRSSSPMSNTSTLERLSVSSYTRKDSPSEPEIDREIQRENPFRKEFFTDDDRSDEYNIYEEIGASRQQKDDSSDSERIKEIKIRTNSYYENVLTNNPTTSKLDNKFVSSDNLSSDSEQKIPIKRPIFKSTGSLFGNKPANKPPVPPRPPNVKHADVVYNEGLKTIQNEMEHGDLVEYMMHNVETNTITIIKTDNNRTQEMHTYDFNDDLPLPPITSPPPQGIRRNVSVERPKESPPPPPINLATMPSRNRLRSSGDIDPSVIEIVPAKYDVFPTPKRVQFVNENSLNNILVTEDTYRELMLQENELRNAISQSHTESKNIPIRQAPPPPPPQQQQSQYQQQQQQQTIIMPSNTPTISSPTGSLQRYQQTMMTPVLSHNQIFPQSQIVPVQYSHLPVPQQAGIFHTFQSPTSQINYSYQSPSTMSQSNIGGFMVSDNTHVMGLQMQQGVTNIGQSQQLVPNMGHAVNFNQNFPLQSGHHHQYVNVTNPNLINWNNTQLEYYKQTQSVPYSISNSMNTTPSLFSPTYEISPIRITSPTPNNSKSPPNSPTLQSFGKQTSV